jgi:hypothetical protein
MLNKSFKVAKPYIVAALGVFLASVGVLSAARYVTNFGKIQLDQSEILDANGTTRLSVGSTNAITGNLTVSGTVAQTGAATFSTISVGTVTVNGSQALRFAPYFITVGTDVPASTGTIAFTSTWLMYVATGTGNALQWVKIGSQ